MLPREVYIFKITSPRPSKEFAWFDGQGYWRLCVKGGMTDRYFYNNVKTLPQYKEEIMGSRNYTYRNVAKTLRLRGVSTMKDFRMLEYKDL